MRADAGRRGGAGPPGPGARRSGVRRPVQHERERGHRHGRQHARDVSERGGELRGCACREGRRAEQQQLRDGTSRRRRADASIPHRPGWACLSAPGCSSPGCTTARVQRRERVARRAPDGARFRPALGRSEAAGEAQVPAAHRPSSTRVPRSRARTGCSSMSPLRCDTPDPAPTRWRTCRPATGEDRYAGWALVVAYEAAGDPPRNLTVFDGLQSVTQGKPALTIPVSGFQTPLSGPVRTRLGFVTYEGDLGLNGDSASARRQAADRCGQSRHQLLQQHDLRRRPQLHRQDARLCEPAWVRREPDRDQRFPRPTRATSARIALKTSSDQYLPHVDHVRHRPLRAGDPRHEDR